MVEDHRLGEGHRGAGGALGWLGALGLMCVCVEG